MIGQQTRRGKSSIIGRFDAKAHGKTKYLRFVVQTGRSGMQMNLFDGGYLLQVNLHPFFRIRLFGRCAVVTVVFGAGIAPAVIGGNPLTAPILRPKDAHRPMRYLAPGGGLIISIPHPHSPEAMLTGGKRLAVVFDVNGLIRSYLAAVP